MQDDNSIIVREYPPTDKESVMNLIRLRYDGFTEWLERHIAKSCKKSHACFSPGDEEGIHGNPCYRHTIATDADSVIRTLQKSGISTRFETIAGTHFASIYPRMKKVFNFLLKSM